jgi:ABC-2 type transport system ATP-binding protein
MYVRLGFSVAINVDPDVLLIDEVLAVGDEEFQRKCLERVADLRDAGKTIVVVTHALSTVRNLCDAAVWLEAGEMRAIGNAADVADAYLGEVHVDRQIDDEGSARWGSGDVRITDVALVGADGRPVNKVCTGDPITIRLSYEADGQVERPVFGLAIHTLEGIHITGPNTREGGVEIDQIEGKGHVDLHVERLMLLPGAYDVSATCTDRTISHVYDMRHKALRFDVRPGTPHETYGGFVSMDPRWTVS